MSPEHLPGPTESQDAVRLESRLQYGLLVLIAILAALSLVVLAVPDLRFVVVAPALDLVINASTTLVAIGVTGLAWARWRESAVPAHYYEAGAFLVLSLSGLIFVVVAVAGLDRTIGLSLAAPQQTPLYMRAAGRLIAGTILLVGIVSALRGRRATPLRGLTVLFVAGYITTVGFIATSGSRLPELIDADGLALLRSNPEVPSQLPGITPLGAIVHLLGAALFIAAALLMTRIARGTRLHRPPYFEVGFVLAAFGELHAAAYPGTYTSLVTTADILRLGFYGSLLLGITADIRADVRALRDANAELRTLRQSELAHAALEERAHLAREIHDGVTQELWLAKLKAGHLTEDLSLGTTGRKTLAELAAAIDAGLADASHAIIALRERSNGAGIVTILEAYVADFQRRFGINVRVEASAGFPSFDPRKEAETIRVVQEALNNARKHADATLVRVVLERRAESVVITIADNGRGFDREVTPIGFGLQSMVERAERIGADLDIESAPSDGTTVRISIPALEGTS